MSDPLALARAAAAEWGLPVPEHLRTGMSALFECGHDVLVRVARSTFSAEAEQRFLQAVSAAGVRVPALVRDVFDAGDGWLVSAVERVTPKGSIEWAAVGDMVRRVHAMSVGAVASLPWCLDFPHWDIDDGLQSIEGEVDAAAMRGLRAAVHRWPEWRSVLGAQPRVVCHGDVHPGNVVPTADGPVLLDWDLRCMAPAGWDHAALLTWPVRWGGEPGMYREFASGYGGSLVDEPAARCLAELRLVVATVMRVKAARTNPAAAAEAQRRLRYWRGEPDAPQWVAQ